MTNKETAENKIIKSFKAELINYFLSLSKERLRELFHPSMLDEEKIDCIDGKSLRSGI